MPLKLNWCSSAIISGDRQHTHHCGVHVKAATIRQLHTLLYMLYLPQCHPISFQCEPIVDQIRSQTGHVLIAYQYTLNLHRLASNEISLHHIKLITYKELERLWNILETYVWLLKCACMWLAVSCASSFSSALSCKRHLDVNENTWLNTGSNKDAI